MEALIPAPADREVQSVIKFLNVQSIAPIKIHRQLCQMYGRTLLDSQHISCRSSTGRCLIIIHPIHQTSRPVISIFSYILRNSCTISVSVFKLTERQNEWHNGSSHMWQTSTTQDAKVGPIVWQMSPFRR